MTRSLRKFFRLERATLCKYKARVKTKNLLQRRRDQKPILQFISVYFRLVLFICCVLSLPRGWYLLKGASAHLLSQTLLNEEQPAWNDSSSLAQPFSYWKKGGQFYAFLGKDGETVLKIPRASKVKKSPDFLSSIKGASTFLVEETGLLYAHYATAQVATPREFKLLDRLGRMIPVDLTSLPFVIQKRKELLRLVLEKEHNLTKQKEILSAFLDLILREKNRGWMSRDKSFSLNVCYAEGKALRIDVGSYGPIQEHFSLKEATKPLCHWLKQRDPQLFTWFEDELSKKEFAGQEK